RPARGSLRGDQALDRELVGDQRALLQRPGGAYRDVAVLEQFDLVRGQRPVLLDQRTLFFEQVGRRVELRFGQLVRVFDAEAGVGLREVERRVGDLDRV